MEERGGGPVLEREEEKGWLLVWIGIRMLWLRSFLYGCIVAKGHAGAQIVVSLEGPYMKSWYR